MTYYTIFKAPKWNIFLAGDASGITHLHMDTDNGKRTFERAETWQRNDDLFQEAKKQLQEYFAHKRHQFTLTLRPAGTAFQKRVWQQLQRIPFGETRSYKDIATAIGNPNSARAIGMANAKNPIPIIIPCHRVIGSNGSLTGFAGGLTTKNYLLQHERPFGLL